MRLDEIEKMKKQHEGKRCALDQDTNVVTNLVSLLEEDDEYDFIKKEKVSVIDLEKNDKECSVVKKLNLESIIKSIT